MKQINFLPLELRVRQARHKTGVVMVMAALVGVVVVIVPWFTVRSIAGNLKEQVTKREQQLAIQPTAQELAEQQQRQRQITDLITRTKALNDLAKQEVDWNKAFGLVVAAVPQDITLTTYTLLSVPNSLTLKMGGTAPSNLSFAAFVESLQANTRFSKVIVDGFTYNPTKGDVTFAITLTANASEVLFQTGKPAS